MKSQKFVNLILPALGLLFLLEACAASQTGKIYVKDGKEYGTVTGAFRGRWWNFYERGLSFSEGEFHKEAITDFSEAIRRRERDQRMARTYGMHFVDYFPHRELGIAYFETGDLQTALKELELSLTHFPSAKARFYLDRVRKTLIEQSASPPTAPQIVFDYQADELRTREDPLVLSGVVEDPNYVAAISIKGIPLFLEGSDKRIAFKKTLQLSQGRHEITVSAQNLLGKIAARPVIIHVDREGPLISLSTIERTDRAKSSEIMISGSVYDEGRVQELFLNGRPIQIDPGVEAFFSQKVPAGTGAMQLLARDSLGNQTVADIPLPPVMSRRRAPLLAGVETESSLLWLAALFAPRDTRPPDIKLKGWTETQTVFLEKAYIEGQVSDENKVVSLSANGQPLLRRAGQSLFFSHLADLKEGENTIAFETRDEAGNTAARKITIMRQIPKALQLQERLSLTVIPFEHKGSVSEAGLSLQDNLIGSLVEQERFRVVERNRLDLILQEQKLSRTRLVDQNTALKLGKLVAAGSVITGSMVETRTGVEIIARMIDTETSEIIETADVYDEAGDLPTLKKLAQGLAIKFHRAFPLREGLIVEQKDKFIFTDLGKDQVKVQRRLIVFREEPVKHPVTGKILGADNVIVGRARITQVMPDLSKAEFSTDRNISVKAMDKVITE